MSRTRPIVKLAALVGISSIACVAQPADQLEEAGPLARPTPDQAAWHDLEIGMMICLGLETYLDTESDEEPSLENLQLFDPAELDTDEWVEAVESSGAKYIVFVAKHLGGFCLWQTDTTDYSVKNTPWRDGRGDVLADLAASCRKRRVKLGVYLSPSESSCWSINARSSSTERRTLPLGKCSATPSRLAE